MDRDIAELQRKFNGNGASLSVGPGGLPVVNISNKFAAVSIALHGAHVLSYIPHGYDDILWLSKSSWFEEGKPIRGGIPICWPWFGSHPDNDELPSHGFARIVDWQLDGVSLRPDGAHCIFLSLEDNAITRQMWDYRFKLEIKVIVAAKLTVELMMRNCDSQSFEISAALHNYFAVSDIAQVSVSGLDQCRYLDTLDNNEKIQQGDVIFNAETDNLYLDTADPVHIIDRGMFRTIRVNKLGSNSTVVWNPWIDKAARMPDFGNDEYRQMLCVETVNAGNDTILLQPRREHRLSTIIGL